MSRIDPNDQEQVNRAAPVLDDRTIALSRAVTLVIKQIRAMRDAGRMHPSDAAAFEAILEEIEF